MKSIKYLPILFFIFIFSFSAKSQTGKKGNYFVTLDADTQEKLDSLMRIGNSYYMLGQLNISIEYYDKAIKMNPNYAKAFFNRGNSNFDLGFKKEACDDWLKALQLGHEEAEDLMIQNCK